MNNLPEKGLYVISDCDLNDHNELLKKTETILRCGIAVFQYRNKAKNLDYLSLAEATQDLCKTYNTLFFVNDDIHLAKQLDADGVHIGKDDGSIRETREFLGPDYLIGASCYNQIELAQQAYTAGANYIAYGAFFPSSTKPNAKTANPSLLVESKAKIPLPTVAIGGISPQNADIVIESGADFIAVVSGLYRSDDTQITTQQYLQHFSK